jgi:hypothetical protein
MRTRPFYERHPFWAALEGAAAIVVTIAAAWSGVRALIWGLLLPGIVIVWTTTDTVRTNKKIIRVICVVVLLLFVLEIYDAPWYLPDHPVQTPEPPERHLLATETLCIVDNIKPDADKFEYLRIFYRIYPFDKGY